MRHAYTLIIIGSLFTIWHFMIYNIDLLNSAVGYLIILLGIIQVERHRPISEFQKAKYMTIGLFFLELVYPFFPDLIFISFLLSLIKKAIPIYFYFCLIKADYMWRPCFKTRKYLQRYIMVALCYMIAFLMIYFIPQLAIILILITTLYFTYLFYILLQLRQNSIY